MSQTTVYVDGYDLFGIGFVADTVRGHRSMTSRRKPTAQVPGRIGPILISNTALYEPRRLEFSGVVEAVSFTEMQTRLDELKYRLSGTHTVAVADDTTRVFVSVRFEEIPAVPMRPDLFQKWTQVSLVGISDDPRAYSTGTFAVAFGSTDTDIPMGTAPMGGTVRISGAAVNPALICKSSTGLEIGRVTLATTIGSTGFIDVHLENWTFIDETGANASEFLNSTATTLFLLDPQDGSYLNSSWPTLQVTAGSGVHTARKAYW
jgi:hypothetical protein